MNKSGPTSSLDPSSLKAHPKNPRKHPKKQIRAIRASIDRFGFTQPVVVDEKSTILVGHGRVMAALIAPALPKVPVIILSGLDEAQRLSLVLADNAINQQGYFDAMALAEAYEELSSAGVDLSVFNISAGEPQEDEREQGSGGGGGGAPSEKTTTISVVVPESKYQAICARMDAIGEVHELSKRADVLRHLVGIV